MNINKIQQILKKEKQNLINLLPEQFHQKMNQYSFICGGAIYSLYNDKEVKDYDFFLKNKEFANELMEYFKSQDVKPYKKWLQGKYKDHHLLISKYAISIGKYQIITRYIGTPKSVVEQFDFKHNCYWYEDEKIDTLYGWEYIKSNKLVFNEDRARDLSGVILRLPKFLSRGMKITKKEIAKILNKLDENGFDDGEKEIISEARTY